MRFWVFRIIVLFTLCLGESSGHAWIVPEALIVSPESNPISQQIRERVEAGLQAKVAGETLHAVKVMKLFYELRHDQPAWHGKKQAWDLVKAVRLVDEEGLNPDDYHLKVIESMLKQKSRKDAVSLAELDLLLTDSFFTLASHFYSGFISPYNRRPLWFTDHEEADYPEILERALRSGHISQALYNLLPEDPGYTRLRSALAFYRQKFKKEKWPLVTKGPKLVKGDQAERVGLIRSRLQAAGYIKPSSSDSENFFDEELEEGLMTFQKQHGLAVDGKVGWATVAALNVPLDKRICQIQGNLDRFRTYYRKFGDRYLVVNIPDFRLQVIEKGKKVMSMPAIVGRRDRKSPLLSKEISYLVFSPFWYVPRSIAVKDKLPIIKKDPTYLARRGMKVYEGVGRDAQEIDPQSIDWETVNADNFGYHFTQRPGAGNALGRVKFMFPNRHSVYIHDTPSKSLFKRAVRTFSSGCIRIEQPTDLAEYVLESDSKWNRKKILAAMHRGVKRDVKLQNSLPVHLVYITSWVDEEGTPQFRNDIYNYDSSFQRLCDRKVRVSAN